MSSEIEPAPKKKTGRPSTYTEEKGLTFCERLLECGYNEHGVFFAGRSMFDVCEDEDMPNVASIVSWRSKIPSFDAQYKRFTEMRAEIVGEYQRVMAQNTPANMADIARTRLEFDVSKWWLSIVSPKWREKKDEINQVVQVNTGVDLAAIRAKRGLPEVKVTECDSGVYEVADAVAESPHSPSGPAAVSGSALRPLPPDDKTCQSENIDFEVDFS